MAELVNSTYRSDDATGLAELINAVEVHAGGHAFATAVLVNEFLSAVREPKRDTRLVLSGAGEPVAYAAVTTPTPRPSATAIRVMGGVHPRWRGRGLGRELLSWQLTRAGQIGPAREPGVVWEAQAGVMVDDASAIRLYRRFGMGPVRYWFDMVAPTAAAPPAAPPDGLRLVPYAPEHEAALHTAHMDAFAGHWGFEQRTLDAWAPLTVRSQRFAPSLSLLAFHGDRICGYLLAYTDADPRRLYIGQVGVVKPWRRRGLGAALLSRALTQAASAGKTHAALGVDADGSSGAVALYERAGFTVESRAVTYSTVLAADPSEGQVGGTR